jgi:urease accessory protein
VIADAADPAGIFAANRAVGRIALSVAEAGGLTRRTRVHEAGSLRVRFPGGPSSELEAVLLNTAGGVAGGDRFDLAVEAGQGARLLVTSTSAEKVYRSIGPASQVSVRLAVASGGALAWLPQETILFDHARLERTIDIDLAAGASLIAAEALIFGRAAMGERVAAGALTDRWRLRRDGRLLFAETVQLSGAIADRLAAPAVLAGGHAVATVLIVPGDEAVVDAVRACAELRGEVGISAWNGFALVRLCARDGAALRHDLIAVLTALRGRSLPRLWLN